MLSCNWYKRKGGRGTGAFLCVQENKELQKVPNSKILDQQQHACELMMEDSDSPKSYHCSPKCTSLQDPEFSKSPYDTLGIVFFDPRRLTPAEDREQDSRGSAAGVEHWQGKTADLSCGAES